MEDRSLRRRTDNDGIAEFRANKIYDGYDVYINHRVALKPHHSPHNIINPIKIKAKIICAANEVAILLGTFNGESFLKHQLRSIKCQSHKHWTIIASDDHSFDNTYKILCDYCHHKMMGKSHPFRLSKNVGFRQNFLALLCSPNIEAPYYAFCDQDDVWEKDKLERALNWLSKIDPEVPAIYCSRTLNIDENNNEIGESTEFQKPPSFANAMVQSLAGANTMVFNHAVKKLAVTAGTDVDIASHDWWLYLLVSGAGGVINYDSVPTVRYRQHGTNFIGANNSMLARLSRLHMLLKGQFKHWNDGHIASLERVEHLLTNENRAIFNSFKDTRTASWFGRILGIRQAGLYRQTLLGQIGLFFASILNKI